MYCKKLNMFLTCYPDSPQCRQYCWYRPTTSMKGDFANPKYVSPGFASHSLFRRSPNKLKVVLSRMLQGEHRAPCLTQTRNDATRVNDIITRSLETGILKRTGKVTLCNWAYEFIRDSIYRKAGSREQLSKNNRLPQEVQWCR